MLKHKTYLLIALVIAISFSVIGYGLLSSRSSEPEQVAISDGDLPEWLLLAHRGIEGSGDGSSDELLNPKDPTEENSSDDIAIDDPPETQPATTTQPAPSTTATVEEPAADETPETGTIAYIQWLRQQEATAVAEEDDGDWYNSF